MDENPDDCQPNDPNHNYRSGYQGPIHLPTSLERRIASDAGEMASAARASRLAQQARVQAVSSAAASASANAVAFARIERSLARSEAITEEETTEGAEIEKWKRSNDAARLRADLDAGQRHSAEIEGEGPALESGGLTGRIVSRMQAESGEREMGVMPSAMPVEMLHAQRDSDKEEMEADAVWPAKIKKEGTKGVPALEEGKAERKGRSKKHAFGLDVADERRQSPAMTPLPPSRAASMSTQVGPDSEATASVANASSWRAELSSVSTPGEVLDAQYDINDMSNGERYLKKVIQDREETTKRLLDHSKEGAGIDCGGLELLGVVLRTLKANALRKNRREECENLLREIESRGGVHGEDRREKARRMAETMIEDYQKETRALEERLVELSRAPQLASLENVRAQPGDLLDRINWAGREEEKEEMEKHRASMRESNLREMERRFGVDLAKQLNDRLRRDIEAAGQIPDEFYHPAQAVRSRFLLNAFPVDGEDIYFRPPCLYQPTRTTEQAAESGRRKPYSGAVFDPSLTYQRYLPQSASGTASTTTSTLGDRGPALPLTAGASAYWPRPNSGTICVTASTTPSTLRGVGPALPLSVPPQGGPPTSARAMQDILDGVQRGEMDGRLNYNHEETNDNPLPSYALSTALPNANRFPSSSLLRQQANDRAGAERFSMEREVLASIAALAGSSINEAQDNEDAQAEGSLVGDPPAFSAAIDGARTMAQVLGEDWAKEMRERTIREREERILKRARQISAQYAPLPAVSNRVEVTRVASHGEDGNDTARSEGTSLENLRPLKLSEFGRQRLDDLRDDEKQGESGSGALPDLSNTPRNRYSEDSIKPRPWLTADRPRPGPPDGLHAAFLVEYQRASFAAPTSQEKTNEEGKGVDSAENKVISSVIADVAKPTCTPGILEAEDLLKNSLSNITSRNVTLKLSRKPLAKSSAAETSRPPPSTLAVSYLVAEEAASASSAAGGRLKKTKEKKKEDEKAFQESLFMAATQEERDEIFRSRQFYNEKTATLKSLQMELDEEFKLKRGEADEAAVGGDSRPNHAGDRVSETLREMEGCLEDMWSRASQRSEAQSRYDAEAAENDDEEHDVPGMADQEMAEKITALKRLQEEFKRGRPGTDEPEEKEERKDNSKAVEARKRFYEDYCREKAEAAKSSARQSKFPTWQRASGRSGMVEAPRPPPARGSTLAELAKAGASASRAAHSNTGNSSRKGHKKVSLEERIYHAKLLASKASVKPRTTRRHVELGTISSSSDSGDALHRFPTIFLLSLDADMINLAGAFQQDPAVQDLTRSQFFELLEKTFPELWVRWKEYEANPLYVKDAGFERRGSGIEKDAGLAEKEQTLRERVGERGTGFEDGMSKAMDRSVQDRGDGKGKGKEKPNLSIATTRTITDLELQIECAKAFNEGNMAAFKDMETARTKGFEEGVKSVMGQQSSGGGPEEGVRSRAGQKSSYLHTILSTFKSETPGPKKEAEEGKAKDDSRITRAPAKDGESVADSEKTKEEEEENSNLDPYGFWGLVQFDSHAGFVGPLPRDFPWQSETCNAELFRLGWPSTLSSLKHSLEDAAKKEFQAMKAGPSSEASSSKSRSAAEAGLKWLEGHGISGFTLLWNWRREHISTGEGMMLSSRTPCLRTRVTERNLQGVLWGMSEESGRHVLLVHMAKRDKEVGIGGEVGEEKNSSQEEKFAE